MGRFMVRSLLPSCSLSRQTKVTCKTTSACEVGGDMKPMNRLAIAVPMALAILGSSAIAVAHADPDSQFLARLAAIGVQGDPAHLIDLGHQVCDAAGVNGVGIGISPRQAAEWAIANKIDSEGYHDGQGADFIRASEDVYCPELKGR